MADFASPRRKPGRRDLLKAVGLMALGDLGLPGDARAAPAEDAAEFLVGQSAILSGPLGVAVRTFNMGAGLALADRNAAGGIVGKKIRLITLDDGLDVDRAVANYRTLLVEKNVLCCFGCVGSATVAAAAPLLRESGVPLLGNYALADTARRQAAGSAYFLRAPYSREAERIVEQIATIGITRIAAVYLDNPGGAEVRGFIERAAALKPHLSFTAEPVTNDGSNVAAAAATLVAAKPQAVIMFISGAPVSELMNRILASGQRPYFYGMSVVAGEAVAAALGDRMRGLVVSTVVPYPWDPVEPTARRFRELCAAAKLDVSYVAYEGYLNGRLLVEALQRVSGTPTRAKIHDVMRAARMRIGGMDLDFRGTDALGSRFVDLVGVTPSGRYIR